MLKALRIIRLLRLVKLLRFFRMTHLIQRLEDYYPVNRNTTALLKGFAIIFLTIHIFACVFHWIGMEYIPTTDDENVVSARVHVGLAPRGGAA